MSYKKIIMAVCVVAICALALYLWADNIVIAAAKRQLKSMCTGSVVTIGRCSIKPARSITLTDIEIKVPAVYDIKIKDLKISYSISSLIKGDILKFYLGDTSFNANMGNKGMAQLKGYFNLAPRKGALKVAAAEITGLALALKSSDVNFSGKVSLALDIKEGRINDVDLKFDSTGAQGVLIENGYLRGKPAEENAVFYIRSIKYNDLKMDEISGDILFRDNTVFLRSFAAKLFGGSLSGEASCNMDKNRNFVIELKAAGLDLGTFAREMKMENKFQMTGVASGKVILAGEELTPTQIDGDLSTDMAGGVLVIKDTSFLENMAKNSGQSLDILMESFRQYQYNTGVMKLSADGSNLVLDIALEGVSGRRNFNVILHDFLSKKGWGI